MRQLTELADEKTQRLLSLLADRSTSSESYREAMTGLGRQLAKGVAAQPSMLLASVCVACTAEDADFLARGMVEGFETAGVDQARIKLICFWNERVNAYRGLTTESYDIAPIIKQYREAIDLNSAVVVVVKSIISGACVVKTNLATLLEDALPQRVVVAAPVMLKGADSRLAAEFPAEMAERFEYVTFAIDDEKGPDNNVVPGIGGSVYERLNVPDKIAYVPEIVKQRRRQISAV
jgi:hypothetical protein